MPRGDYEGTMATAFDAGRALLPETIHAWHRAVRPLRPEAPYPVLDLGSGTSRFAPLLARWFARPVVAVEPAGAMRGQAAAKGDPEVRLVGGTAERIPLRSHSMSIAWLSNVVHHFDDLGAAARELRRVLRLASRVLIRGWFPGLSADLRLWDYFPDAGDRARRFPGVDEIREAFRPHGFAVEMMVRVDQQVAADNDDFLERLRHRADSTLAPLHEREFESGFRRAEADVAAGRELPLRETLDLIVLR